MRTKIHLNDLKILLRQIHDKNESKSKKISTNCSVQNYIYTKDSCPFLLGGVEKILLVGGGGVDYACLIHLMTHVAMSTRFTVHLFH